MQSHQKLLLLKVHETPACLQPCADSRNDSVGAKTCDRRGAADSRPCADSRNDSVGAKTCDRGRGGRLATLC